MRKESPGGLRPPLLLFIAALSLSADLRAAESCDVPAAPGSPSCTADHDPGVSPRSGDASRSAAHIGNPVEIATGNKYERTLDFRSISSPLAFTRHYNSAYADSNSGLGYGWRHSYQVTLGRVDETRLQILQADGRRILFDGDSGAGWHSDSDGSIQIVGNQYVWQLEDGRAMRFERGQLVTIDYAGAMQLNLTYEQGQLTTVSSSNGPVVQLEWQEGGIGLREWQVDEDELSANVPAGHLRRLVLPDGSFVEYAYSPGQQMREVTYRANEKDASGSPETVAEYFYHDDAWGNHLTGTLRRQSFPISEARASTAMVTRSWAYDDEGRAVEGYENGERVWQIERSGVPGASGRGVATVRLNDGESRRIAWSADEGSDSQQHGVSIRYEQDRSDQRVEHDANDQLEAQIFELINARQPVLGSLSARLHVAATNGLLGIEFSADREGRVTDLSVDGRSLRESIRDIAKDRRAQSDSCESRESNVVDSAERLASGSACLEDLAILDSMRGDVATDAEFGAISVRTVIPVLIPGSVIAEFLYCDLSEERDCDHMRNALSLAELSNCAYNEYGQPCIEGWESVEPESIGLSMQQFSQGDFHAELFREEGTGRYVLVFRGTDGAFDIDDSLLQTLGITGGQYDLAMALAASVADALADENPNSTLEFSGHSLGGGLATAAAMSEELEATVFNPAALSPATALLNEGTLRHVANNVDVFRVEGELLNLVDNYTAPGTHFVIDRPAGMTPIDAPDLHRITSVIASLEEFVHQHCTETSL